MVYVKVTAVIQSKLRAGRTLKLQRAQGNRPLEPADAAGIDTIGRVLLYLVIPGNRLQRCVDMPDLYLVEGLNQVRRRGEFAVKKKTFTTKDTRRSESF